MVFLLEVHGTFEKYKMLVKSRYPLLIKGTLQSVKRLFYDQRWKNRSCHYLCMQGCVSYVSACECAYKSMCNPRTYREVNDIVSETDRPIKTG